MRVILYSTGCPKCKVLMKKMDTANIEYEVNTSIDEMQALGFSSAPKLSVGGSVLGFMDAIKWINQNTKS